MKLVGFCGQMCSGKSTAAAFLHSFYPDQIARLSFAAPIKQIAHIIGGVPVDTVVKKDAYVPGFEQQRLTWRRLYQLVGTEFGRNLISNDVWIKLAEKEIYKLPSKIELVIFDDVRFENEIHYIHKCGGRVYRILRNDLPLFSDYEHVSEQLPNSQLFDGVIENNGSLNDLKYRIALLALDLGLPPTTWNLEDPVDAVET